LFTGENVTKSKLKKNLLLNLVRFNGMHGLFLRKSLCVEGTEMYVMRTIDSVSINGTSRFFRLLRNMRK